MSSVTPIRAPLAVQTFEIRPTPPALQPGERPDELMIDWGNIPAGSSASIYLPGVSADEVLQLASTMYPIQRFERADAHTLSCTAGGIVYLPIPKGPDGNFAGLLSMNLPATVSRGELYTVVVRQITNKARARDRGTGLAHANMAAVASARERQVLGSFQVSLPVKAAKGVLLPAERLLAVLLWFQEAIAPTSRWHPVFIRYLHQLKNMIAGHGGDPGRIMPSPTGFVPGEPPVGHQFEATGKVDGIVYDRFGDFEGFVLETRGGDHLKFFSGERRVFKLIYRAWVRRTVVTVVSERGRPRSPVQIILRGSPP